MDSTPDGRPLRDALAALAASDRSDLELRELLSRLGRGSAAAAQTTEWREEEAFREAATTEENGAVLVAPAPLSSAAPVSPTTFVAWTARGPADSDRIRVVYASFASAEEGTI